MTAENRAQELSEKKKLWFSSVHFQYKCTPNALHGLFSFDVKTVVNLFNQRIDFVFIRSCARLLLNEMYLRFEINITINIFAATVIRPKCAYCVYKMCFCTRKLSSIWWSKNSCNFTLIRSIIKICPFHFAIPAFIETWNGIQCNII